MTDSVLNGLFRGICVDNKDPRNLGRIRVQVPQILGTAASGWAFPAWSFHETTVWPKDRLPDNGEGVWVMFDSTSPDKMIWMAAFGSLPLINQPGFAPEVEYESSITFDVVGTPELDAVAVFYGDLTSTGAIPNPNPVVYLERRSQSDPDWSNAVVVAQTPVIDPGDGSWSISYTLRETGPVEYRAVFPGVGVFGPAISPNTITTNFAVDTVTTTPTISSTLYHGTGFTTTGTIKSALDNSPVTEGTVTLWRRATVGADTAWKSVTSVPVTNGTYTLTSPALTILGPNQWKVEYTGTGRYVDSTSGTVSGTVNLRAISALTKGAVTHSSAAISWSAISGAIHYRVEYQVNDSGTWVLLDGADEWPSLGLAITGLTSDRAYSFRVRANGVDPANTPMTGGWSPAVRMTTGHAQQTDVGETGWVTLTSQYMDSHRIDTNWTSVTDMRQGYFSSSYGGEGYLGVSRYTGTRVRDAVIAACGSSARHSNGACSAAEINLTRGNASGDGVGGGPVTITFYTTMSDGTGSRPTRDGSGKNDTSTSANGAATWQDIGTAHGDRIGRANANSIAIYRNDKTNYAQFTAGSLRLKWAWNYISVAYVAPTWTN